jgi:2-dehydropantoate 2-reductase
LLIAAMMPDRVCESDLMRFVVLGAGAIGGVVGGRLAQAGEQVVLIARGAHLEVLQRDGLRIEDPDASATLSIPAVGAPGEVDWRPGDVVLLAVKSQQTADALGVLRRVAPDVPICCLQNGVENERVALRYFADVYAVVVMLPATHLVPGVVQAHSAPTTGLLDLGRYPAGVDDTARTVAAAFAGATFSSEARPDIMRWKYRKLVLNLGNALEALTGDRAWRSPLVGRAMDEGEAVLAAAGIDVASRDEDTERRGDHINLRPVGGEPRGGGSSWQSLQRGTGSIETDYLSGEIVRLGRIHGVPTPVNELLQRSAVTAAERGDRPGEITEDDLLAQL